MPTFPFLVPNDRRYTCLTMQPQGRLDIAEDGIRNSGSALHSRCFGFLALNAGTFVDLRVCPEYCFPWEVLVPELSAGRGPKHSELWVFGCEALKKSEIKRLADDLHKANVECIFDEACIDEPEIFVNPLAYVFRSTTGGLCVALQFKSVAMSASNPIEVDHMVRGRVAYFIENNSSSIRLTSIICSEALEFEPTNLDGYGHRPYLILHPQLNPNPTHDKFRLYRKNLFGVRAQNVDLLCLNWAKGTCSSDGKEIISRAHSALYTQLPAATVKSDMLERNHRNGVYFFRWEGARAELHVSASEELCVSWSLTKTSQHETNLMSGKRRFPKVNSYKWQGERWDLLEVVDQGSDVLGECDLQNESLAHTAHAMELEVFIGLCAGEVEYSGWPNPHSVSSVRVADDEVLARTVYVECEAGREKVSARVVKAAQLRAFLANPTGDAAAKVAWLKGRCLSRIEGNSFVNLEGGAGTAVHLGGQASERRALVAAERLYNKLPTNGRYRMLGMFLDTHSVSRCVEVKDGASIAGTGEAGDFADAGE